MLHGSLNGPGGMPWTDKWCELGHEGYIPQVYFYSRDGKPLNVVNTGKNEWNWHSFTSEDVLVVAMREAIDRDNRIAGGEKFNTVVGKEEPPPPPPPPPPPSGAGSGCMEGWAGADCDECATGWSGEDCDVPPGKTDPYGCMEGWTGPDCDECAENWGGQDCDM